MPKVHFTSALQRFFPGLQAETIAGEKVEEVINKLDLKYPGLKGYICEDDGQLRQHVNIFVKNELIHDREKLQDVLEEGDEVLIMQALSGG